MIPQDELQGLLNYLEDEGPKEDVDITFYYEVKRKPGLYEMASGYREKKLSAGEADQLKKHINETMNQNETSTVPVAITKLFPRYLRALTTKYVDTVYTINHSL